MFPAERTERRLTLVPQEPKKLHRVKEKLYVAPACKKVLEIGVGRGRPDRYLSFMNATSLEMFCAFGLVTLMVTEVQVLPPLPVDAEMSRVGESHTPTVLGADIDTVGMTGFVGATIVRLAGLTTPQELQEVASLGHWALT